MIDLHLHTTASDGYDAPSRLVERAHAAGVRVMAVTDHDTVAGLAEAADVAARFGLQFIPGIEITAVWKDVDVHVLGYFGTVNPAALAPFLETQRRDRIARIVGMAERLEACGVPIDVAPIVRRAADRPGESVGRPLVARALIRAGHVATMQEAFDRWIAEGRPAFVPRTGAPPAEVVRLIGSAGGLASFAHPGPLGHDELVPELVAAGLQAIEAFHSEHDEEATAHYRGLARRHGLAVSGGSDYHGGSDPRVPAPGAASLPQEVFTEFRARLDRVLAQHPSCPPLFSPR